MCIETADSDLILIHLALSAGHYTNVSLNTICVVSDVRK